MTRFKFEVQKYKNPANLGHFHPYLIALILLSFNNLLLKNRLSGLVGY
jgi:hypothetical protein